MVIPFYEHRYTFLPYFYGIYSKNFYSYTYILGKVFVIGVT